MMMKVIRPVRGTVSRVVWGMGLMAAAAVWSPVRAQVEPNDPACRETEFMAGALEAIKQKLPVMLDKTEVSERMVASGLDGAALENPAAASKGPGFLGCNYDLVVGADRIRMFAKQTTDAAGVTWLVTPAL